MFKYIMCLVLVLVPMFASAQESEGEESLTPEQQSVEFCNVRYPGTGSADVLKRLFCIQHQNVRILETRVKKGESGLATQVDELRKQLEATKTDLAKQATVAQAQPTPNPPAGPSSDPAPTPQPQGPSLPAFIGGMPFGVMDVPGQLAATTWNVQGIDLLWIKNLHGGVQRFLDGAQQVRIVVRKNGVMVPIAHQGPVPFLEFYADLDNDGKVDSRPYKGVDPSAVDDIYISDVRPSDQVEVIYLVRTRKLVTINGLPPQTLWGSPTRAKMDATRYVGRRVMSASTAMVLR